MHFHIDVSMFDISRIMQTEQIIFSSLGFNPTEE